jgi:hypothetical protein
MRAPLRVRNSHALGDPATSNFRFGHPISAYMLRGFFESWSMIPKSGYRFSEKIMLK